MVLTSAWAQVADVATYTGVVVDAPQVMQAQAAIEIMCGRTYLVPQDTMKARDIYYLKLAVAYQCAWMTQQPDFFGRSDVSSFSQDGQSITYDPATAGKALVCAPLARRALKRLTWMRSRSLHTDPVDAGTGRLAMGDPIVDYDDEEWH